MNTDTNIPNKLKGQMNREVDDLSASELMLLDAARGLNIHKPPEYRDKLGLRPSLADYNRAIKNRIYIGVPIAMRS